MTSERFDPPRAEEQGPDALRELVRERRRGPSADSVNQITARIAARVSEGASNTSPPPGSAFASWKYLSIVLAASGGLLLAPIVTRSFEPASSPSEKTPTPAPTGDFSAPPRVDPIGAVSIDELPTAAPSAAPPSTPPPTATSRTTTGLSPSARATANQAVAPVVSELEVTRRAQDILASDPRRALAMADDLAHAFPNGEFVQEREAIAVEALARLGRSDDALERGRALLRRFPRTPYATRLEKVVGRPLTSVAPTNPPPLP